VPAMSMPTSEHTLLTHLPLVAPEVKRTVGLIRRRGRIQSYIAAELEKQITEQYRRT
ncbi:MAG TPA: LysR family transcriptional regulator, partial [Enterobacter asburiae]|nr:LysR family transcriptional regulator [Enterobacter asburiae]